MTLAGIRLEKGRTKQLPVTMYEVVIDRFPLLLIISLFPDHSLGPENVACTIKLPHYGTAFQLQPKPRPLLLTL